MSRSRFILPFIFTICLFVSVAVYSQENFNGKIIGIWARAYKTVNSEGMVIFDFAPNRGLKITLSVNIDEIKNAAFVQCSGIWRITGSQLSISISSETQIKWTAGIAEQLSQYNIDQSLANQILSITERNLPTLGDLNFSENMFIRHITDRKLTLADSDNTYVVTLTRRQSYPQGGKINIPKQEENSGSRIQEIKPQATFNGLKAEILHEQKYSKLAGIKAELDEALTTVNSIKSLYDKQIVTKQSYLNALATYKKALTKFAEAGGDVTSYPTWMLETLKES